MSYRIVIPARIASNRFPEKLLKPINGKILLWHTWQQAMKSKAKEVVIATDSEKILSECTSFGAKVIMTSVSHPTGTDRIHEVCDQLNWKENDIVVNVQGDEPLISVKHIDLLANMLEKDTDFDVATLAHVLDSEDDIADPNVVKVVYKKNGEAMYFSRSTIPHNAKTCYGHIGLYGYRIRAINGFVSCSPSTLEQSERLEQLRFLENGFSIKIGLVSDSGPVGVNTEKDYLKVKAIIETAVNKDVEVGERD